MPSTSGRALSRMAGNSQANLSFEGILQILAEIPAERLKDCRRNLSRLPPEQSSCCLLQVMILWHLGERDEARMQLSSLRDDAAAARLYECCWGDGEEQRISPGPRKQDERVSQTLAEIYSLLVDENLCEPLGRDYREATKAFQASNAQGIWFANPPDRAVDEQGLQVPRNNCRAPVLGGGQSALPGSDPLPIEGSSPPDFPHSLHSRESSVSFPSSFEISEASSARPLTPTRQAEASSHELGARGCSESPDEPSPDAAPQRPTQYTPTPNAAALGLLTPAGPSPPDSQSAPPQQLGTAALAGAALKSGTNLFAPTQSAGSFYKSPGASLVAPEDEKQFYTFVVLHAKEDEPIACRVKEQLESMGVSNGATFSKDFLVPGHCQLSCFQNALDNSAFTLLLLTGNFKGQLCAYHRDTALMNSLSHMCKHDSVIPFVPKESSLRQEEMPLLLKSLVPLWENCPTFAKKVVRTFTQKRILEKKQDWDFRQKIQEKEQQRARRQEYLRMQQRLSELSLQPPAPSPGFQGPFGLVTPCFPFPPMPQMQTGFDQASLPQPPMFSVGCPSILPSVGPPPQLIIQNAQMVQIGDHNCMHVEKTEVAFGPAVGALRGEVGGENENEMPSSQAQWRAPSQRRTTC